MRAGRVLKYQVIHPEMRYGVRHSCGWMDAEMITGASVADVEQKIDEILGPVVQALSVARMAAGFRLPENFGDHMRQYLREEYQIIDRVTGMPVGKKRILLLGVMAGGLVNSNQLARFNANSYREEK